MVDDNFLFLGQACVIAKMNAHMHMEQSSCIRAVFSATVPKDSFAGHWWLMPVIPATQEAEIRRIVFQSQPRQTVLETLF
jgi:hypothetical protein